MPRNSKYTEKEDLYVLDRFMTVPQIANKIDRSEASVMNRRRFLYLKQSKFNGFGLSWQEYFVLKRVAQGMKNKEIADQMNLSERTIEVHRRNTMLKMNAKNYFHAIKIAYDHQILEPNK